MLQHLIHKYSDNDTDQIVYRLSYAGKFIIVKGATLCGSLIIIDGTYHHYRPEKSTYDKHLYKHLYDHYNAHEGGRFRVKVIARVSPKLSQYQLLKREQMEIDKNRFNPACLNNATEVYIPLYNAETNMHGWLERTAVMSFKRWLGSKERRQYLKRYAPQVPISKPLVNF